MIVILTPSVKSQSDTKKNILILNSYNPSYEWAAKLQQGIISSLEEKEVVIHQEFMGAKKISDSIHAQNLYNLYTHKYKNIDIDLIIATDDFAFDFLLDYRQQLFASVPVVFTGVNNFNKEVLRGYHNYYGVSEDINIERTFSLALSLHSEAEKVVAFFSKSITGDKFYQIFKEASSNYDIDTSIYKVDTIEEVKKELKSLPKTSIVFLGLILNDKEGNLLAVKDAMNKISSSTNQAIYSFWQFYLGSGIVGGHLLSASTKGKATADLAWEVLEGTIEDKTIIKETFSEYSFDYQELKRLEIKEEQLPDNSQIINRPNTFYYQYRNLIWSAVIILLILCALIITLIFSIKKYRAAITKLDDIFTKTNLVFWSRDLKKDKVLDISNSCYQVYGFSQDDFYANPDLLTKVIANKDRDKIKRKEAKIKNNPELDAINLEYRINKKDGTKRWVKEHRILFRDFSGELNRIDSIVLDITERKQVEKELITYANYDVLTGVYNRRMGLVVLERDKQTVIRQGVDLTVCFVDINNLKFVNDNYGHDEGDRMIKTVAEVIKSEIRGVDTLVRLGGDEFLISFPGCGKEQAENIWNRILEKFKEINDGDDFLYNIIVSHGLAQYQETDNEVNTIEKLINLADQRMYLDKTRLKNKYSVKK